jgi:hypothetical protein
MALFLDTGYKYIDRLGEPYSRTRAVEQPDGTTVVVTEQFQHVFYGYMMISPKSHFSWGEGDRILERIPGSTGMGGGMGLSSEVEFDGPVASMASDSSGASTAVIAGGRLYRVLLDRMGELRAEPLEFEAAENSILDFDRSFGLHLIEGQTARFINWQTEELKAMATLPAPGTAMVVIDEKPHVLMPGLQAITTIEYGEPGHNPIMTNLTLPLGVMANEESRLAMLPGGRLFLLTDGTLHPMRITPNGLEAVGVPVPRNGQWRKVFRAGDSSLCLADESNRVEVYDLRPEGFARLHDHAFNGIQPKANFLPSRSRMTLGSEASDMNFSDDQDDAGETVLDCPADLNFDGVVDSADLGRLLGEWNSSHSLADLNDDGLVGSADLGLLLGAFGVCP